MKNGEAAKQSDKNSYSSPAVARAVQLLRLIADNPGGITLAKLCRESGITKNSVFRILNTLAAEGILEKDQSSQHFTMTGQLLGLAFRGTGGDMLSEIVLEPMRHLRDATSETVLLGKLMGDRGVVLEQIPSSQPVKVQVEIGVTFPLHCGAPAKAIIACLPPDEQKRFTKRMTFTRYTDTTLKNAKEYLAELKKVTITGIALDRGEIISDIRCAAAAILDHRKQPIAAIWITGPASRLSDQQMEKVIPQVIETARSISRHLGGE